MPEIIDIEGLLPHVTTHRRTLHQIPEEGLSEHKTQAYVKEQLETLHPDKLDVFAQTGLRAVFYGKGARTIAFRADMDALSLQEPDGCPFASKHEGFMHACGHDGHMAALLGLGQWICARRNQLRDTVVLLFQPAEESVGGAQRMIEEGALKDPDVDEIFGMHMMPDLPMGTIGMCQGPMMAQTCEFDIDLTGKSAHGAQPHFGVDTVVAAAHLVTQLQTMLTRQKDPFQRSLITVGKLTAGDRRNIIADHAKLECTIRTFDDELYEVLRRHMLSHLAGLEMAFGVQAQLTEMTYYPAVNNPEDLFERIRLLAKENFILIQPKMVAEDFSYFQQAIPGAFFYCGCATLAYNSPLHTRTFAFDERALLTGIEIFSQLIALG